MVFSCSCFFLFYKFLSLLPSFLSLAAERFFLDGVKSDPWAHCLYFPSKQRHPFSCHILFLSSHHPDASWFFLSNAFFSLAGFPFCVSYWPHPGIYSILPFLASTSILFNVCWSHVLVSIGRRLFLERYTLLISAILISLLIPPARRVFSRLVLEIKHDQWYSVIDVLLVPFFE